MEEKGYEKNLKEARFLNLKLNRVGQFPSVFEGGRLGDAMGIDESLVREIVRRILSIAAPDKIILFGSAASGGMTRDSDIDLLIVDPDPGDRHKEGVRLRQILRGLGYPFDIIVISTEWFEESKNVIGGIAYPANKYGKVIYEAA